MDTRIEPVARELARQDWPVAPLAEQRAWIEANWQKHVDDAKRILNVIDNIYGD